MSGGAGTLRHLPSITQRLVSGAVVEVTLAANVLAAGAARQASSGLAPPRPANINRAVTWGNAPPATHLGARLT